jgi:hypothetical protein
MLLGPSGFPQKTRESLQDSARFLNRRSLRSTIIIRRSSRLSCGIALRNLFVFAPYFCPSIHVLYRSLCTAGGAWDKEDPSPETNLVISQKSS